MEEESSVEAEKTAEPGPVTRQPHVMACYHNYLAHFQVKLVSLDTYLYVLDNDRARLLHCSQV